MIRTEKIDSGQEVAESLVVHDTVLDSLANGHPDGSSFPAELDVAREKLKLDVLDLVEASGCDCQPFKPA